MKKLLIGLVVLISGSALADTWVMPNEGGGQIVISDRLCQGYKHIYQAYAYTNKGYIEGCWALMDNKVHIVWEKNNGRRVYEMNDFVPDQVTPKKKGVSL